MKKTINVPTIPLPEAIARVTRFRNQFTELIPETEIPRAVLIPIDDLLAIVSRYESIDKEGNIVNTLKGVRAYFAVKASDQALPDDITALIVPVDLAGNDIVLNEGVGLGAPDFDSEVYDFTMPCPTECDVDSPLYIP